MHIIKHGDDRVSKIVNKHQLNTEAEYRLSFMTFLYSDQNRYLIRNMLTLEVTELTKQEWDAVLKLRSASVSYKFIRENGLIQLALSRYIVETSFNEVKQYQQTVFLLQTVAGIKKGLSSYIIFPTTGCNARCVYCYEEGIAVKTMTAETAERLVRFICETRQDDEVTLRWFGGEPLAAAQIIRQICTGLQEHGVPYHSTMVTNASLMTQALAQEAKTLWHLKIVQVSLDGAKNDYEMRKKYYNTGQHNYETVMQAIRYLAEAQINVRLRVNVDFDNIERIPEFLQDIKARFGDSKHISLYLAPLYQEQRGERCLDLYKEIFRLTDLQKSLGIPKQTVTEQKPPRIRTNYCMSDSLGKSIVITPDGFFNNCEHLPETHSWGNIFDGVTDQTKFNRLLTASTVDGKCTNCPFLPECTPFYKNGCPAWFEKCYEYHCMKTKYMLQNLLHNEKMESEDNDESS